MPEEGKYSMSLDRCSRQKWLQDSKMDRIVTRGRLLIHLQKAPQLSKEWGEAHWSQPWAIFKG